MKKNRITAALFAAVLSLTACGSTQTSPSPAAQGASPAKSLQIVTAMFPEYDWTRQILGERADQAQLTMLLDNGVDLHSFQPTVEDIMQLSTCDLFIHVGGESDQWVEDALKEATNKDMKVINLMEVLGDAVKEEEIVEGMDEHEHSHDEEHNEEGHDEAHDDGHVHDDEEHDEYDEHIWLSLRNAVTLCDAIADALSELDPEYADTYRANADAYQKQLSALDAEYQTAADNAAQKTLLFADRFPFRYLLDDYGLSYYAAFAGCSAETEASFQTITFLSEKANELGLCSILTIDNSNERLAQTIIENTSSQSQQILTLNSMQSITSKEVSDGASYLSIMESNLEVLKQAFQ